MKIRTLAPLMALGLVAAPFAVAVPIETATAQGNGTLGANGRNVEIAYHAQGRFQRTGDRRWVIYSAGGGPRSDLYRLTSARQRAAPLPRRPRTRNVNAGPIWSQQDAEVKCPVVAHAVNGRWTGGWRTTQTGRMSVCAIEF